MSRTHPRSSANDSRSAIWRLLRVLFTPFRRIGRWFRHQPRAVQVGLLAVLVAGLAVGGYYARSVLLQRQAQREAVAAWRQFHEARQKTDLDAMRSALDRVLAASPDDVSARHFLTILDTGSADADSPDLALSLMRDHFRAGRVEEAAREAEKVLARQPKHWQARCMLAHHALAVKKDPALAATILDQLPDGEDSAAHITITDVLHALALFERVGRDSAPLRQLIVRRVVPMMRSAAAASASPAEKAQLIACYLIPFHDRDALSDLAPFWAATDKLAEEAVHQAISARDVAVLTQLAPHCARMRSALITLRIHDPKRMTDETFAALLTAVDNRTRRAWEALRQLTPDRPAVYVGLAQLALLENDIAEAMHLLEAGAAACGDSPELLSLLLELAEKTQTPEAIRPRADALWQAAEIAKTDPVKWTLAATAQAISRRAERALEACAQARAIQPNHLWTCNLESVLWARTGNFLKARESLAPLGELVYVDPRLARLHARVLVGCGLWLTREEEYRKVLDAQAKLRGKSSVPAVAFLLGILDAPADVERATWVAMKAELILAADSSAPRAAGVRAEALYRLADLSATHHPKGEGRPPLWNSDRVTAALRAFDRLPLAERVDPDVLAAIAILQFKGEGNAGAAMRTVEPLLAHEERLSAGQLEALGVVLTANNRPGDAVRVLSRATRLSSPPSVGCLVALAMAHHKNGQPGEARATLKAIEEPVYTTGGVVTPPPRSGREQAELVAFKLLRQREKQ